MTFSHSSGRGGEPTGRDDVGIVPYIPAELHSIHLGAGVVRGGGRLAAAPTGYPVEFVHEVVTHAIVVGKCKNA